MSIQNALAGIAVRNLETACPWYELVLGGPPQRPMPEVAEWPFPHGGWIQVFADAERAGKSSVTLSVSDLEAEVSRLHSHGIEVGEVNESSQVKIAFMQDLDGNQIVLAQPLTGGIAQ